MDFTPTQEFAIAEVDRAIAAGERKFVLWYGGIRAGKSFGAAELLVRHSIGREGEVYAVGGFTQRQVLSNLAPIFEQFAKYHGLKYKLYRGMANPRMTIGDNEYLIFGGGDAGKAAAIQGLTLSGLLLDEFPLLHREFVAQAEARTSVPGAIRVYTANKAAPYDWSTIYYYNRAKSGEIDALLLDTPTADNHHLDHSFIAERNNEYDELHRARFMDNDFRMALPPVYQWATVDKPVTGSEFSVVLADGGMYREVRATSADQEVCIIGDRMLDYPGAVGLDFSGTVLLDATRPTIRRELQNRGYRVRGVRQNVSPKKMELCQRAFSEGRLTVAATAEGVQRALTEYTIAGAYPNPIIPAVEIIAHYITQRGQNAT